MTKELRIVAEAARVAGWPDKRQQTARRITQQARRLAADRGFDEFTLDELAAAADVSRRTLFNYFQSKVEAVLGLPPASLHSCLQRFAEGGPTGELLDDALRLGREVVEDKRMSREDWVTTAIVVAYDDSDGWYDHVAPKITNGSTDPVADKATCTTAKAPIAGGYQDRCGPSQRLPLVVVSPYAKTNFVSHSQTTQPSILKFVEDNWNLGRVGDSSFDANAGSLNDMFNFHHAGAAKVLMNSDGSVASVGRKND